MIYDIVVLGEVNVDLILSGDVEPAWSQAEKLLDDAAFVLGGSSAIFACGAARLGLRVGFVGVVGDDLLGRFCRDGLAAAGVDVQHVVVDATRRTGMTVILQRPDDRAMLTHLGTIAALERSHIPEALLTQTRHAHVGSYWMQTALQPDLPQIFAELRRGGATTSIDTNWDPSERWAGMELLLGEVDMLLPNEGEALGLARALAGRALPIDAAAELLAARVPTLVLKRGGNGALAMRGGERVAVAAPQVAFVDAVGAGDSFDAGFVYGQLSGWELARSLALASACGSLSCRAAGGTAAQPTLAEALALAETV